MADYAAFDARADHGHRRAQHPYYGVLTDKAEDGTRDYHWGDLWHYATARMVVAAARQRPAPVDGPFGDFSDADGYKAQARRAAVLGCEGKWAIHPSQIALANEVFTPSEARSTKAKRILEAMDQAQKEGKGAVALDGRLIDIASIRQAEVMVKKAEQIASLWRVGEGGVGRLHLEALNRSLKKVQVEKRPRITVGTGSPSDGHGWRCVEFEPIVSIDEPPSSSVNRLSARVS